MIPWELPIPAGRDGAVFREQELTLNCWIHFHDFRVQNGEPINEQAGILVSIGGLDNLYKDLHHKLHIFLGFGTGTDNFNQLLEVEFRQLRHGEARLDKFGFVDVLHVCVL